MKIFSIAVAHVLGAEHRTMQPPFVCLFLGLCWLKKQEAWDGSTDLAATNLKVNVRGDFTERFRKEHQSAPLTVPWVAGIVKAT